MPDRILGISKVHFLIKKNKNNFSSVFFQLLVIKTQDQDPARIHLKMPDPDSMHRDPQHWLEGCVKSYFLLIFLERRRDL
jgi:hypothetical protein